MIVGTTYSHRHIKYLGLDNEYSFSVLLDMNFDLVRLCVYWSEIEKKRNIFDFSAITSLLDQCEENKQNVIVTVGMKAPRWPEYYIPEWVENSDISSRIIFFIHKTINELKGYNCIKYWQVENEPLDPVSSSQKNIKIELLRSEVKLVRKNDARPIITTVWGNNVTERKLLPDLQRISDIVGIDLYYKQAIGKFIFGSIYSGPKDSDSILKKIIAESNKPIWITELQAEAWEYNQIIPKEPNPRSISANILKTNFRRASQLNPEAILLWGFEYWLWDEKNSKSGLLNTVKTILTDRSS